jgi:UDP-glucose 6-dehydrogenase
MEQVDNLSFTSDLVMALSDVDIIFIAVNTPTKCRG